MRSTLALSAVVLVLFCANAHAVNKCIIDGKVTYQEAACPSAAVATKVETNNRPMDPANETFEQRMERLKRTPPPAPMSIPNLSAKPSPAPVDYRAQNEAKLEAALKESDEKLAKAKAACGGNLPEGPTVGMSEQNFRNCTVVGVLVAPDSVNVTETAAGVSKQFVYLNSAHIAGFKFLYTRNGKVTTIQR